MTAIDAGLLSVTERFCHWIQRLTGVTNVWLAVQLTNVSIAGYFAWAAAYSVRISVLGRIALALFCVGLMYVLTQTVFKVPLEMYENAAYLRAAKGFRNPRRLRDAQLRSAFLILSVVLAYPILLVFINVRAHIVILSYAFVVLTTAVLYLLACDPLPPCTGKVVQWLRSSIMFLDPVHHRLERS
jgi:hypothetical protein